MNLPEKELLRPEEVADYFSISKKTVFRWCVEERIKYCKPNGVIRIFRNSVLKLVQKTENTHIESIKEVESKITTVHKGRRIISKGISK
ncbi:MAG: helix-turn-helix domain-containing protein [Nitrospinae bacterium]|nr:helix-turn-helix domain-containing protein [Nitrospinota bacterium]